MATNKTPAEAIIELQKVYVKLNKKVNETKQEIGEANDNLTKNLETLQNQVKSLSSVPENSEFDKLLKGINNTDNGESNRDIESNASDVQPRTDDHLI